MASPKPCRCSVRSLSTIRSPSCCSASFLALNGLFFYLMRAPTELGRPVMDQLAGLKLYLETAEADRMNMQAPEITAERFEALLPYAVALNVEKPWSDAFAAALRRAHPGRSRPDADLPAGLDRQRHQLVGRGLRRRRWPRPSAACRARWPAPCRCRPARRAFRPAAVAAARVVAAAAAGAAAGRWRAKWRQKAQWVTSATCLARQATLNPHVDRPWRPCPIFCSNFSPKKSRRACRRAPPMT